MTENVYSPSAFENNDGWTGPEYAYSSNNLYASTAGKGDNVTYRDYGIASVLEEEPSKVEVGIEAYGDGDDYVEVQVSWDGGVSWTALVGHVPPTTDPDIPTYVDVTNGRTWTWDELSNANFRVRIYKRTVAKGADINLDWIPVRITSQPAVVGWRKLQYATEPPTAGVFNKLKYASEPPVPGAWNKLLYEGE